MVDQTRRVPWHIAINVQLAGQREDIHGGVPRFLGLRMLGPGTTLALVLVDEFANVLDDLCPGGDVFRGIDPPTVDLRAPDLAEIALAALPELLELFVQGRF